MEGHVLERLNDVNILSYIHVYYAGGIGMSGYGWCELILRTCVFMDNRLSDSILSITGKWEPISPVELQRGVVIM